MNKSIDRIAYEVGISVIDARHFLALWYDNIDMEGVARTIYDNGEKASNYCWMKYKDEIYMRQTQAIINYLKEIAE